MSTSVLKALPGKLDITRKAAKLREFKVFSHCTPTVLHVVAEISHGKDSVFFQLIPKELEFDP